MAAGPPKPSSEHMHIRMHGLGRRSASPPNPTALHCWAQSGAQRMLSPRCLLAVHALHGRYIAGCATVLPCACCERGRPSVHPMHRASTGHAHAHGCLHMHMRDATSNPTLVGELLRSALTLVRVPPAHVFVPVARVAGLPPLHDGQDIERSFLRRDMGSIKRQEVQLGCHHSVSASMSPGHSR